MILNKLTNILKSIFTKKRFTIKDLSDGKCAVINDGTVDEIRKVLKKAFPDDDTPIQGLAPFYFVLTNDKGIIRCGWWCQDLEPNLPVQSVKHFKH